MLRYGGRFNWIVRDSIRFHFCKKKTTTERRRETGNEEVSFRFVLEEGTILYKFWFIAQRESR